MSQSNYIVAAVAIAFLVYITVKGSLANYINLLTGGAGFGEDTASAGNKPQQTADVSQSAGEASAPETANNESGNQATENPETGSNGLDPFSIFKSVAVGGQADEILDAVKMFGMIG